MIMSLLTVTNNSAINALANDDKSEHLLISANSPWRYLKTIKLNIDHWNQNRFDDTNWPVGNSGFGYGDDDDRTRLDSMQGNSDKLLIRKTFSISDLTTLTQLHLYIRYDDAFIAYLNGYEVARSGVYKKAFKEEIDDHEAKEFELFTIKSPLKYLHEGDNLFAVVGFNRSIDSSDFSIEPVLSTVEIENPELPISLTKTQWHSDLDYLQSALSDQSSYVLMGKLDYEFAFQKLKTDHKNHFNGLAFARELQKMIAQIGDAHADVNVAMDDVNDRYLPFVPADSSIGVVAINSDLTGFIDPDYPKLLSIDGLPVEKWLAVAAGYVPQSSKQLIRYQSFRQLRSIDRLRTELERPGSPSVEFTLSTVDGLQQKSLNLKTSKQRLPSAKVKLGKSAVLEGDIGYMRIVSMYDSAAAVVSLMQQLKDTKGLIIDVRNNRGGYYDILQALYGFFIADNSPPYVSNIAAYRLSSRFDEDHLHYRPTFRLTHKTWSKPQQKAIQKANRNFEPQWELPAGKFSEWHYMLLGKSADYAQFHYQQPVVVLSNPASFSATDGFLSAFADLPQVTLMGQASGGGSGAKKRLRLPNSGIEIALSSMASFRPNGKLYDTNGVEVAVTLIPEPSDFISASDSVLEKAVKFLEQNINP